MKLSILAVLTLAPCLALAQATTDSGSTTSTNAVCSGGKHWHHRHSATQELAWLTKKLDLNDTQQGQIGPVLTNRDAQKKAIFENTSLTKEQKHDQIKALMESSNQQIESFLTPGQVTQFEALHHHNK